MWRNLLILAVTIIVGAGATYLLDGMSAPVKQDVKEENKGFEQGQSVPEFAFTKLNGESANITDFKGKIVVLNFWASWCTPCVKEMPLFLDMAAEFSDRLVFIGLSSDFTTEKMNDFLDKMASKKPEEMKLDNVLFSFDENGDTTRNVFQTYRLPETIIINADGTMVEKLVGADWKYQDLQKIINNVDKSE